MSFLTWQVMNVLSNFVFPEWPPSGGLGFAARLTIATILNKLDSMGFSNVCKDFISNFFTGGKAEAP